MVTPEFELGEPELELEVSELEELELELELEPDVGSIVLQLSVKQLQWDQK